MLYGLECLQLRKQLKHKLEESRMLRHMSDSTLKDKVRDKCISKKLEFAFIEDKMSESCLRWFGYVSVGQ